MPEIPKASDDGEYTIVQISDLHFGSKHCIEVWSLTAQFLEKIKPDLLLITGDLVDNPRRRWYEKVKRTLDGLGIRYYVCAGNHDRFWHGNQFPLWTSITVRGLFFLAAVFSGLSLWGLGAVWGWWLLLAIVLLLAWFFANDLLWILGRLIVQDYFAEVFLGKILVPDELKLVRVPEHAPEIARGSPEPAWTIGLFGVDSNSRADASARGYVSTEHFDQILRATEGKDCDLCLFLVHHHLLSIRRLEEGHHYKISSLLNLTGMVNAGSLLETLAAAHVDLVLHGHEHEHNFAAYGSLSASSATVKIVAAGSATGNRTGVGCSKQHASFNVLKLKPDRSVWIGRYWLDAERWRYQEVEQQLEAETLRLNRMLRLHRRFEDLDSEITKCFEFTRERDIWVSWVLTNWRLPSKVFTQEVRNSTGWLDEPKVRVGFPPYPLFDLAAKRKRMPGKSNTWQIEAEVPPDYSNLPVQVELKYCWREGAILTAEEMEHSKDFRQEHGTPRSRGYEFAMGRIPSDRPVTALDVIVVLPEEYAPTMVGNEPEVEVFVENSGQLIQHQAIELRRNVRVRAKGLFAFRVAYPQADLDYQLAWKPVPQLHVNKMTQNEWLLEKFNLFARAAQNGKALLEAFRSELNKAKFPNCSCLALYVPNRHQPNLDLAGYIGCGGTAELDSDAKPPDLIPLFGSQNHLMRVWRRGEPQGVKRPEDEIDANRIGFLSHKERVVFGIPIRFSLRPTNPPPWAVVRIGITDGAQDLLHPERAEQLSTILLGAATTLLYRALAAEYTDTSRDRVMPQKDGSGP